MTTTLDTVDTLGGVEVPNFFNGRILSAEDLRLVMRADLRHRMLLGRALGPGVAAGLRVARSTVSAGVVTVTEGVAVNHKGETIDLPANLEVRVAGTGAVSATPTPGGPVFADCGGTSPTSTTSNAFLLTVRPDSLETGSAPADPYLTGQSCGPGFVAEGVRFRRVPVDPTFLATSLSVPGGTNLGTASPRARNVVSHLFLGSTPWSLFGDVATAGDVDPDLEAAHRLNDLQTCEVPLALFYLQGGSVVQLDEWAVRRPCRAATDDAIGLAAFTSGLRSAAGVATYLQFQTQLAEMLADKSGPVPEAGTHFRYLPAAGILPRACIGSPATIEAFLATTRLPFFDKVSAAAWTRAERPIRSARVESVIRDGTQLPPVDLATSRGLPVTVVVVQESMATGTPYAVFVAAQHPYRERIDLDEVIDRLSAVEPPVEAPLLTVVKQSQALIPRHDLRGYRLVVTYRVVTNRAGLYQISASASKRTTVQAEVAAFVHGDSPRTLDEGATIVTVDYLIRDGGDLILDVDPDRRFAFGAIGVERAPDVVSDLGDEDTAVERREATSRRREIDDGATGGPHIDPAIGIFTRPPFTFGIDVASVDDPELTATTSFGFDLS